MARYRYVRSSGVRALVKDQNKRCGADFLNVIDKFVYEKVLACCRQFNGHRVTLDGTVAKLVLGEIKTR
jgi:hypothetical protein